LVGWNYKTYWDTKPPEEKLSFRVDSGKPGIYILRVVTRGKFLTYIETDPPVSFGIMPMRTYLYASKPDQFKDAFVYVPPRSEKLVLNVYGDVNVLLKGESGVLVMTWPKGKQQMRLGLAKQGQEGRLIESIDFDNDGQSVYLADFDGPRTRRVWIVPIPAANS
jgi:hypothetical protein